MQVQNLMSTPPKRHHPVTVSCPSGEAGGVRFDSAAPKTALVRRLTSQWLGTRIVTPPKMAMTLTVAPLSPSPARCRSKSPLPNMALTRPPLNCWLATWVSLPPKILVILIVASATAFLAVSYRSLPEKLRPLYNTIARGPSHRPRLSSGAQNRPAILCDIITTERVCSRWR